MRPFFSRIRRIVREEIDLAYQRNALSMVDNHTDHNAYDNKINYPTAPGSAETLFIKPLEKNTVKLHLVHIGVHENGNAGDTLLFPVIRALFQKYLCQIEFTLLNLRAAVTQTTIDIINEHDGVVIGGGGLFLKDTNANQISGWQWACSEELLSRIKVPIVVFAVGYNRFRGQEDFDSVFSQNLNILVDKSAFFSLRNKGSIENIKNYLHPSLHDKLFFQPCPTTVLSRFYPYEKPAAGNKKVLAINIPFDRSKLRYENKESSVLGSIAESIREIEAKDWKVILLHHFDMDAESAVWLNKCGATPEQINLGGVHPDKIIEFYNSTGAVIGGRGHAQMIPFGLNIPIFSLISHNKMKYFLDDINHSDWGEEVLSPSLKNKLVGFADSARTESIKKELEEAQNILWRTTMANMEKLALVFNV